MGHVAQSVASTVSNVAKTVTTVITNPSKANIGQIASVVLPVPGLLPVDAAQHKEDRVGAAVITGAAISGAYLLGSTATAATVGTGSAASLGLAKAAPAVAKAVQSITGTVDNPVPPPSTTNPVYGPPAPDYGVWSTGGGGGAGNVYANPAASGTTTPQSTMPYILGGGAFLILLIAMMQKRRG